MELANSTFFTFFYQKILVCQIFLVPLHCQIKKYSVMKAKDLKRFEEPFKVELGKIDALGCGRKENLVVLEFNLYSGKGTHRDPGDEYVSPINLVVHNRITTGIIMSVSPSDEQLSELIRCGLNPLYEKYLKKAHDLIMKNCWLKYTRLVPSTIVAGIIDNLLMVEKISKM